MIIPSRWMASGLGLSEFRNAMLADKSIKQIVDFPDSNEVFAGVEVKGGICYFVRDRNYSGMCDVTTIRNNTVISSVVRDLNEFDILVRNSQALPILRKVLASNAPSITEILSVDKEFGWTSNFSGFDKTKTDDAISLYYINKGKRQVGWIKRNNVIKSSHLINTWKVMVPKAGSDGGKRIPDYVLGQPLIAPSPSVCTQSFLFFYVKTEKEAQSVESYLRTKFFRFLVSLRKLTQDATRSTYNWVPKQNWDSLWTDEKLYDKYGLTTEEIEFIESVIRSMELTKVELDNE